MGDNVLAVELHQSNSTGSDEVFGLTMSAVLPTAPVITNQPIGITTFLGVTNANLSVSATGTAPLFYQWYSNTVQIAAATNAILPLGTAKTNAASYYVVVSNDIGAVTSAVVSVLIVRDTVPPQLVSALGGPAVANGITLASNNVLVTFNERLDSLSANTISNYHITLLGTEDVLPIVGAQLGILVSSNVSQVNAKVQTVVQVAAVA